MVDVDARTQGTRSGRWLMKSEPACFSLADLRQRPAATEHWDGVRNYQVRNLLRDDMRVGDRALFYHSSCPEPGVAGCVEIVRDGYADITAQDPESAHHDPRSTPEDPVWYMVDVRFMAKFPHFVPLTELRKHPALEGLGILARGSRLSITPISRVHWDIIVRLGGL